jgi:hypothetical protein
VLGGCIFIACCWQSSLLMEGLEELSESECTSFSLNEEVLALLAVVLTIDSQDDFDAIRRLVEGLQGSTQGIKDSSLDGPVEIGGSWRHLRNIA